MVKDVKIIFVVKLITTLIHIKTAITTVANCNFFRDPTLSGMCILPKGIIIKNENKANANTPSLEMKAK